MMFNGSTFNAISLICICLWSLIMYNKIRDLFRVKLYLIRSKTKKRERERERERKKKERKKKSV